jgi:hypothetical protein
MKAKIILYKKKKQRKVFPFETRERKKFVKSSYNSSIVNNNHLSYRKKKSIKLAVHLNRVCILMDVSVCVLVIWNVEGGGL